MALVNKKSNKKVGSNSRQLSQAREDARYNAKYFENTDKMLRITSLRRIIDSHQYSI
ncbi:MAG: hypothetical protein ACXABG_14440 [Promethearchaeota archaeon]|jgi:hypothetical protein